MNKKVLKILTIIITILIMISINISVYAAGDHFKTDGTLIDPIVTDQKTESEPTPGGLKPQYDKDKMESISTVGQKVMGIINTIGVVIAVVVLMILGIKYMMGSAEEKAEYKKTFIPYIIGAVLIFAATTIANVIYQFAQGLTK